MHPHDPATAPPGAFNSSLGCSPQILYLIGCSPQILYLIVHSSFLLHYPRPETAQESPSRRAETAIVVYILPHATATSKPQPHTATRPKLPNVMVREKSQTRESHSRQCQSETAWWEGARGGGSRGLSGAGYRGVQFVKIHPTACFL